MELHSTWSVAFDVWSSTLPQLSLFFALLDIFERGTLGIRAQVWVPPQK
jgi:hypothetical protein